MRRQLISWLRNNVGLLAVLFVAFLVYVPSLNGTFVVDDVPFIKNNPYLRDVHSIAAFFTTSTWGNSALENNSVPMYRPVDLLVELVNRALFGDNAFGYHGFQLLLHLANTCLVFSLVRSLVPGSAFAATMSAAVFALHPTRVESVAWLSGLPDPLAAFFLLLALVAHRSFTEHTGRWWYVAVSLLCFQLALWSKEVAVVFPIVVVAHDLIYRRKIHWPTAVLHGAVVLAYLIARSAALGTAGSPGMVQVSGLARVMDFSSGYSELLVLPLVVPFYLQPPGHSVSSATGAIAMIAVAALIAFFWRTSHGARRKDLTFSLCWAVAFFWPAILMMFYRGGYYSARFLYIPSIGVAVAVGAFYEHVGATYARARISLVAAGMSLLLAYGFVTAREIPAWHDDEAIYGKMARNAPESSSGFAGLGQFYLLQENYPAAERNFLLALERTTTRQERASVLVALGTIQGMSNNLAVSERYLKEAVEVDPSTSDGWAGLGNVAWIEGRMPEAITCYEKAVSLRPGNYEATMNLAMAYERVGQQQRAALLRQRAASIRR